MPGNPSLTAFAGQVPPWSLTSLDTNFTNCATLLKDVGNYEPYVADTGASNAYVVTYGAGITFTLAAGAPVTFKSLAANTGASTLAVNGGAAKAIVNPDGSALAPGQIPAGAIVKVVYDGTSFQLQSVSAQTSPPTPNLVINPNWLIDQINEGGLYTASGATVQGPDGWSGSATGAGVFKLRTLADPDNAALKCLEITCTTADAAIAAADNYNIYTAIEGYDAAALMAGTASALPITIQFKFKTNVTGVYGIAIHNSAGNRRYIGIITVADANEHEYVTTLTMDTAGTWLYTTGIGLYFNITLAAGSNFQAAAGAWAAGAEQTTAAQCNFMSANTNIAYLKRIQVFQGSGARPYAPANYQAELAKAQRYYVKTFPQGTAVATGAGNTGAIHIISSNGAANVDYGEWTFPVVQRVAVAATTYNPVTATANWRDTSAGADAALGVLNQSDRHQVFFVNAGVALGNNIVVHATANARLS